MSLQDVPIPVLLEQIVYPDREKMVGERFKVAHLTSTRGRELNGKFCVVTGFDRDTIEARLHCLIDGVDKQISLKLTNLIPEEVNAVLGHFMEHSASIPDATLAACLERAIEKHGGLTDRADLSHRIGLYRELLSKLRRESSESSSNCLSDADYCFPCGAGVELLFDDDPFGVLMNAMRPACHGNEMMDMRFADIGLKGDGHTECTICREVLAPPNNDDDGSSSGPILVTLPCLHIFHESCIVDWLGSLVGQQNWNCPCCRAAVPDDISTYRIRYDEQLQRRIDEYPLSGFCTKCIMWVMERNRNDTLPIAQVPI